jgi:YVTN family beta-propeller protein
MAGEPNGIMRFSPGDPKDIEYAHQDSPPRWIALNAAGTRMFVSSDRSDIDIYDVSTMARLGNVPLGGMPTDLTASPNGKYILAPVGAAISSVVVIDAESSMPVRFIRTPISPGGDRATPTSTALSIDATRLYVSLTYPRGGRLAMMDPLTQRVLKTIPVGRQPQGVVLTKDDRRVLVANSANSSVSVVDAKTLTTLASIHTGPGPIRIVIRPDGTRAYVTCKASAQVTVLKIDEVAVMAVGRIPVGAGPVGMAISADGRRLFVANTEDGTVSTIDTDLDAVIDTSSPQPNYRSYGVVVGP